MKSNGGYRTLRTCGLIRLIRLCYRLAIQRDTAYTANFKMDGMWTFFRMPWTRVTRHLVPFQIVRYSRTSQTKTAGLAASVYLYMFFVLTCSESIPRADLWDVGST